MTRKLPLLLVVCLGFWHSAAFGLGLGEIAVDSALNQRFEAEIELRNTASLATNEIIANLASSEDFERVGVERFFFLSDLQFETDLTDPRRPVVRVTSSQPVTEPFVNFVVEILWPSGRLLREYTVLLDPPTYAARPAGVTRAPSTSSPTMTPPPRSRATDPVRTSVSAETAGEGMLVGDTYGVTDRNDTLWAIALKVRPEASLSAQQTMLALLRRNPEAFIGGNINQLKAGFVLRVPDADEIRRLSFDDAVVQVSQQNERWRDGLDREPLDARPAVPAASGGSGGGGELRLVAAQEGGSPSAQPPAAGAAGGTGSGAAAGGASAAELESARADADALRSRLSQTEERAAELARELELKNEQLARAQQVLQQQMANAAAPSSSPAPAPAAAAGGLFGFSWMLIGGVLGGLVVLVGIVLVVLRRLGGGAEDDYVDDGPDLDDEVAKTQLMPALSAADIAAATGAGSGGSDEGDDVIGEADVYMVYGRFSEAARVLSAAIDADPQRADIRLKLLEVYVESGDADAFNVQAQALSAIADAETIAQADQLAMRLPGAMTSSGDVTEGSPSVAPARAAAEGEVSLDFDLAGGDSDDTPADLDSLDIDLDLGPDAPAEGGDGSDLDLDFDLDVGGDDAPAASDDELALSLDGDDDDLGLSLDGDDDELALSLDGDDDELALSLDGDDEEPALDLLGEAPGDDDALPDLDFSLEMDGDDAPAEAPAEAPVSSPGDAEEPEEEAVGIDFDFDAEDEPSAPAAPAAPAAASDDLDLGDLGAVAAGDADEEDGGLDFDIEDLAEPEGATSSAEDELAALGLDDDDEDRTMLATSDDGDFDLDGDDFDFGEDAGDEISTKLELARAYVDMGDEDGAREILDEVVRDGDDGQKQEAGELLQNLG